MKIKAEIRQKTVFSTTTEPTKYIVTIKVEGTKIECQKDIDGFSTRA